VLSRGNYNLKKSRNIILGQQQDPVFASLLLKEGNWANTAIVILEEFSEKKQSSAITMMAKSKSLGFGCNDTNTTNASYSMWHNATKALRGSDFITGKMKKIQLGLTMNYDCDHVTMAISSKSAKGNSAQLQRQERYIT
jgi:hypothetical protein